MAELNVKIVAADRQIWQGPALMVVVKTVEGEIGIMPGHEPVLALLVDGVVRVHLPGGERQIAAVHQGFFSVDSDNVAILAETAELASEIDVKRAEAALERAKAAGEPDEAAVQRAEVRLRAAAHPVPHS
ncbi:MAG TPA: F0F1 ATP synthase subunit epsilon [Actinomycetes bacterium]